MKFDGFLNSFSCGLGRVIEHAYRVSLLVHDFILVVLLLVLLMIGPLRASRRFVLIITLALSFELISHGMFLKETQRLYFQTKFCILLTLMIS
jgi:phosphoglycerol transferase MdoB-like AlkP superfamily enzyme